MFYIGQKVKVIKEFVQDSRHFSVGDKGKIREIIDGVMDIIWTKDDEFGPSWDIDEVHFAKLKPNVSWRKLIGD